MLVVIGLGTNQGNREENLKNALEALQLLPKTKVLRISSVYETKPYGFLEQPDFLNMVAEIQTDLSPSALLGGCLGIEAGLGRIRLFKNGPRVIDLDVLIAEHAVFNTEELRLPHPEILNRSFVLVPLKELYSNGTAFDFSFEEAYQTHSKDDIQLFLDANSFQKI